MLLAILTINSWLYSHILQLDEVIDGEFTSTDDELASLKTKFDLQGDLEATAKALKELDNQTC